MSEKADIETPQNPPKYEQVPTNIPRKPSKLESCSSFISKLLIFGLALYGLHCLSQETFKRVNEIVKPTVCNCGSSISEAKSKDCKFDSLATSWLPPACRDDELTAEFERSGPLEGGAWPYYKDLRKTHLLSVEDLANMADNESGDRTYYMTTEWYIARCLFYWRKMERAERFGTTIEKSFLDTSIDGHNISSWHHCANVYLEGTPRDQISTAGLVGFGDPSPTAFRGVYAALESWRGAIRAEQDGQAQTGGKGSEHALYPGNEASILPVSPMEAPTHGYQEHEASIESDNPLEVQPTPGP